MFLLKKNRCISEAECTADFALLILWSRGTPGYTLCSQIGAEPTPPLHGALSGHSTWVFLLISILCTLSYVYLSNTTEQAFASHSVLKLLRSVLSPHTPRESCCEC